MQDSDIERRIARLEALMSSAAPTDYRLSAAAVASGELDSAVLDRVAATAERLGLLVGELRQEVPTDEWNAADRLTARLLLNELTTAVRGCRAAAAAAGARLQRVERALAGATRLLDH